MANGGYAGIIRDKGVEEAVRVFFRRFYKWTGMSDEDLRHLDDSSVLNIFVGDQMVAVRLDLSGLENAGPFIGPNAAFLKVLQAKITLNLRGHVEPIILRVIEQVIRAVTGDIPVHFETKLRETEQPAPAEGK